MPRDSLAFRAITLNKMDATLTVYSPDFFTFLFFFSFSFAIKWKEFAFFNKVVVRVVEARHTCKAWRGYSARAARTMHRIFQKEGDDVTKRPPPSCPK